VEKREANLQIKGKGIPMKPSDWFLWILMYIWQGKRFFKLTGVFKLAFRKKIVDLIGYVMTGM